MARSQATAARNGDGEPAPGRSDRSEGYTVVARRYRPRRFEDVVGQDHVVQALRNALRLDRVAQAYLFSGTRGVGKTSMARIFAKCLNCEQGPTETPCDVCEICQSIASGQDVDVIEIDGASNNGVDAVRELRQNAGLRPSRSRFKIYYIDEVHMLSTGAFNALLKTLEEPPSHVKFFFATTEPNKIPITVLSRCQRYDFAGIAPERIVDTLAEICTKEGVEADREALQAVGRRAAGSMRDAQSLLEQLLSAGDRRLTAEVVYQILGIAGDDRVLELLDALADRNPARVLERLDQAVSGGVQPVEVLNGVIEFLRDVMVLAAGAEVATLAATPGQAPRLREIAGRWPLDSILAAQQILAETRSRLRGSPHGRLLVELGLCRVARLEDLSDLGDLVAQLSSLDHGPSTGPSGHSTVKKKSVVAEATETIAGTDHGEADPGPGRVPGPVSTSKPGDARSTDGPLRLEQIQADWPKLADEIGPPVGPRLRHLPPTAMPEPDVLAIGVPENYNWAADLCDTPEARAKIETRLFGRTGRPLRVRFDRSANVAQPVKSPSRASSANEPGLADDSLVSKIVELFEARLVRVDAESRSGEES
ncbi:hypothetical protein BH23PLA1_BH23PLA1_32210 [soil metagenome]